MLSRHAHLCVTGDHGVIMDISSGKYVGLSPQQMQSISPWVHGWPSTAPAPEPQGAPPLSLLNRLAERGVLTSDAGLGKSAEPLRRARRTVWLSDRWLADRPHIGLRHVWRFARAVMRAAWLLRWRPLNHVIADAAARKAQSSRASVERDEMLALIAIYEQLRRWIYARRGNCMLHSMALLNFLAYHGIHADWVIGVRVEPFKAHSWLEYRDLVLTDAPESLDAYTPVIAI